MFAALPGYRETAGAKTDASRRSDLRKGDDIRRIVYSAYLPYSITGTMVGRRVAGGSCLR